MQTEPRSTVLMGSPAVLPSLWPAFALCLSMAVANGLGRFAYALLLPAMREDLQWTYAQAGWLNTANALGYVLGAGTAYALLHRVSARRLFQAGLGLCVFTLAVTGASGALPWLSTQRVLNGVGAAWVSACGSTLVLLHYRHAPNRRGAATGLFFGGAGIGLIAAGLAVAPLLAIHGAATWPTAWLVLGPLGFASIWPMTLAGRIQESTAVTEAHDHAPLPLRHLGACLAAYFCWAGGYIIYLTFILRGCATTDCPGSRASPCGRCWASQSCVRECSGGARWVHGLARTCCQRAARCHCWARWHRCWAARRACLFPLRCSAQASSSLQPPSRSLSGRTCPQRA